MAGIGQNIRTYKFLEKVAKVQEKNAEKEQKEAEKMQDKAEVQPEIDKAKPSSNPVPAKSEPASNDEDKEKIKEYFSKKNIEINLKYIDPSYMIRSLPANANDSVFCGFLGRDAVHAGMAGKSQMLISHWNNYFVHVPLAMSAGNRKQVLPGGKLWRTVLEATGQGPMKNCQ